MRAGIDLPAPPETVDVGGGGSDWVALARASDDIDAHLLTGRLQEAGIETAFVKDRGAPGSWLYGGSNPWAPVVVLVRRYQFEDARIVLAEIAYDAPPAEPEPRSSGWDTPALVWCIAAVVLGVFFTAIALLRTADMLDSRSRCDVPLLCLGAPR